MARLMGPAPGMMRPWAQAEEEQNAMTQIAAAVRKYFIATPDPRWDSRDDPDEYIGRKAPAA